MAEPGKICVICGKDCTGRPRTKDPRGRYYCQPCYDRFSPAGPGADGGVAPADQDAPPPPFGLQGAPHPPDRPEAPAPPPPPPIFAASTPARTPQASPPPTPPIFGAPASLDDGNAPPSAPPAIIHEAPSPLGRLHAPSPSIAPDDARARPGRSAPSPAQTPAPPGSRKSNLAAALASIGTTPIELEADDEATAHVPASASPMTWSTMLASASSSDVRREGDLLVVPEGAELKDRCVLCNEPVGDERVHRSLSRHHPAIYATILIPPLYLPLAILLRKTARVRIGVCAEHRRLRRHHIAISWTLYAIGAAIMVLAFVLPSWILAGTAAPFLLGTLVYAVRNVPLVIPHRIEHGRAWLAGCHPDFLAQYAEGRVDGSKRRDVETSRRRNVETA